MDQLGPNALGEVLESGRAADCYLGLLLPAGPVGEPAVGTVLIAGPAGVATCLATQALLPGGTGRV